jgi:RNA-directed DNA polymerase
LGENRKIFPIDDQGVAQGSPLSPLFGNILLNDFDLKLNGRGISCIRFIDDFVILGKTQGSAVQSFQSAQSLLQSLGLNCHDPFSKSSNAEKAGAGKAEDGFVFLGYDLRPGLFQPSRLARQKLEKKVDEHLAYGRWSIREAKKIDAFENRQRYIQTLSLLDKVIRGWGNAFAYGNSPNTIEEVDRRIDLKMNDFRLWFSKQIQSGDWKTRRRLGGVCLLSDIPTKNLDDVPFSLDKGKRFSRSPNTVTISTDGSIFSFDRRKGKDQGPGGWAFVIHDANVEFGGRVSSTTNNRMELKAVIEAIKYVDPKNSIIIRTDSQYVTDAANGRTIVKTNTDLWKEFEDLRKSRRVKVIWVKGHAGDTHNEAADRLAAQQARLAKEETLRPAA